MDNLLKLNLDIVLKKYIKTNKPILGICLGMQLLFESSEEFGIHRGLGFVEGKVLKLKNEKKLPHISWSEIKGNKNDWDNTILDKIEYNTDFYFVHTYVPFPDDIDHILSISNYYKQEFCSTVKKGNIYGTQYHPEKSSLEGLKILKNFINITKKKI